MRTLPIVLAALVIFVAPVLAEPASRGPLPIKVLLIGDSLSVDGFGEAMQKGLQRRFGDEQVAVFASCGSSPEDWIKGGFVTNCGYRQTTPAGSLLLRYDNGARPRRTVTPKLRNVLSHYRPEFVIVQLGTNWMDRLSESTPPGSSYYRHIIRDFVREVRRGNPTAVVFWVMPPSSAAYSSAVHKQVEQWINEESRKLSFYTVNSRSLTGPYRKGVTGGDGVHYSDAAGASWARGVLDKFLQAVRSLTLAPAPSAG